MGRRAQNFPALVVAHLSGTAVRTEARTDGTEERAGRPVPEPFADVPRRVLRRFQPREVDGAADFVINRSHSQSLALWLARSRLARYEQQGGIRDLWDAVRLLRATARTPATGALLAECLLALWDIHRDRAVLREAEDTVRAAADPAGAPPAHAHLVLGKVLRARAATEPDDGTRTRVLAEAAESLECAYALVRSEPRPLLDDSCASSRWSVPATGSWATADCWDRGPRCGWTPCWRAGRANSLLPGSALLARGALLMELCANARERDSADEARALAVQAAADFESAAGLAERAGEAPGVVCRAWLELAAARAVVVGDEAGEEVVAALTDALRTAGTGANTGELRLRALWRLAQARTARWTRTAEPAELDAGGTPVSPRPRHSSAPTTYAARNCWRPGAGRC